MPTFTPQSMPSSSDHYEEQSESLPQLSIKLDKSCSKESQLLFTELFVGLSRVLEPFVKNSVLTPVLALFTALNCFGKQEESMVNEITMIFSLIKSLDTPEYQTIFNKLRTSIFVFMSSEGTMKQNRLQRVCHHVEKDIRLLQPIMDILTMEQCASLFFQPNGKGWNVLALVLYYCSSHILDALLPYAQKLNSTMLKDLLMFELSYVTLPRFAACAKSDALPGIMTLMEKLDTDGLEALISMCDNNGFTLLHYVVFYCPQHLNRLLQLVEKLEPRNRVTLLNIVSREWMTPLMSAIRNDDEEALSSLLETVNKLEFSLQAELFKMQDPWGNTVLMQALQKSSLLTTKLLNSIIPHHLDILEIKNRKGRHAAMLAESCSNKLWSQRIVQAVPELNTSTEPVHTAGLSSLWVFSQDERKIFEGAAQSSSQCLEDASTSCLTK